MANFELTGPDGAKYQLDAPDENSALSAFRTATGAAPGAPAGAVPKPEDTEVSASNVVRSGARGVPIFGGLADKANAATNAILAPLIDPLLPDQGYEKLPESSLGDRYKHALDIQNRKDAGFDTAHPVISTGAKIAGGMAAFGGAIKAAPALAKLLGFEGTLPQMVGRGATSGALISGADAATRGEDVGKGAAVGAVTGAAAPLVGLAIGKGIQAVKGAVRGKPPLVPESTVDVAGVTVPLPNRAPAAADQVEIARRGGFGESARDVVAKGDAAAQEALDAAKGNIATSLDPGGAVPPQNAAERVASELRAAEANRFATQQAAAGRAAGDVAAARQAVAGGAPAVAGPEAAAEGISADLRTLEGQRAASEAATTQNVVAGTEALRRQAGAVSPEIPPQVLAESPGAAAETIGTGVRDRAAAARQAYNAKYEAARGMDSEFAPGAFRPVGQTIRQRLNLGDSPVRADDRTTPFAVRALEDLDTNIGLGNFQNEAAPTMVATGAGNVSRETASDAALAAEKLMSMGLSPEQAAARVANLPGGGALSSGAMSPHDVAVPGGGAVSVRPKVVEASSVRTSADPGFDPALQPRNRARAASDAQVNDIASNLNPNRLGASAEADRGAPIVGPDGMVESGNGRVLALRRAYQAGGPQAQQYRDWLASQGADVSGLREPILVRERATQMSPEQRRAFTVAANQSSNLSMSATERALADSHALTGDSLAMVRNPADLGAVENRDFVRQFVAKLPQAEQGAMTTASGDLSSEGLARVRNAVIAKAYGNTPVLARIAESTKDDVRSISNALVEAAPEWASLRSAIASGRVPENMDMTGELLDAVNRTAALRARGSSLGSGMAQVDAFSQQTPESQLFQRMFYSADGERAAPASQVATALRNYAQEAGKVDASPGLDLGLAKVTPRDILEATAAKVGAPAQLAKSVADEAERAAGEAATAGKKVSLDDVDAARKRLVTFYRDARGSDPQGADARATRRVLNEFDQYVIELVGSPKYKGDPKALDTLLEARRGVSEYKSTFGAAGPGDEVGRNVEKILGRYPGQEATADQIAQMSYGSRAEPGGAQAVKVSQRLRSILGETSPEWGAYKQGLLSHLIDTPPGGKPLTPMQQADRLDAFLNGTKGRPLAQVILSPEERAAWASHAQALRASQPVPLSALDDTDRLIARISGRDGSAPPAPAEVADLLYGRMGTDRGQSIGLVQRLKQTFGADSEQFSAIKQGMVARVVDGKPGETFSPAQQADRLESFMSSSMAKVMLNDGERGHLEAAARSLRAAEPAGLKDLGTVDKVLARITGRDGSPPASLNDVTDYFFGPSSGKRSLQFQLATRLKRELSGEGWNALRVGMWSKLTGVTEGKTDLTPKRLSDNIFDFINGPGSDLAKAMYSPAERAEMLKFAEAVKAHIPVPGSTNPSGTAPMLAKMANKAGHAILPTIGFAHGGLPGALIGVGADKALSSVKNAAAANRVGLLYYGKQPKVPDDPRLAIAAAVFARSLPQGQSAGNR